MTADQVERAGAGGDGRPGRDLSHRWPGVGPDLGALRRGLGPPVPRLERPGTSSHLIGIERMLLAEAAPPGTSCVKANIYRQELDSWPPRMSRGVPWAAPSKGSRGEDRGRACVAQAPTGTLSALDFIDGGQVDAAGGLGVAGDAS